MNSNSSFSSCDSVIEMVTPTVNTMLGIVEEDEEEEEENAKDNI